MRLTVHCLVKNEERFVYYAVKSVVDFVDQIIIFDTGSSDKTVEIIKQLAQEYSHKIIFEEKGLCDKSRHTQLRQEMVDRTKSEWFMILDGDEIWTRRGMEEALTIMGENKNTECLIAPFYLCVGDIYHKHYKTGSIEMLGKKDFFYPRFFKLVNGIYWQGDYDQDTLYNNKNQVFFNKDNAYILKNRFWHTTHLIRSLIDSDFSSGGSRHDKIINTYFLVGKRINEPVPEVFVNLKVSFFKSFFRFWPWIMKKILKIINKLAKIAYKYWMKFAHILGTINGFIILFVFYFAIIGVYAIVSNVIKLFLGPKGIEANSCWKKKIELAGGLDSLKYQF